MFAHAGIERIHCKHRISDVPLPLAAVHTIQTAVASSRKIDTVLVGNNTDSFILSRTLPDSRAQANTKNIKGMVHKAVTGVTVKNVKNGSANHNMWSGRTA